MFIKTNCVLGTGSNFKQEVILTLNCTPVFHPRSSPRSSHPQQTAFTLWVRGWCAQREMHAVEVGYCRKSESWRKDPYNKEKPSVTQPWKALPQWYQSLLFVHVSVALIRTGYCGLIHASAIWRVDLRYLHKSDGLSLTWLQSHPT